MLICDCHADTLYAHTKNLPEGFPYEVQPQWLQNPEETRVQALAMFIPPKGMEQKPPVSEKMLSLLPRFEKEGWRQIRTIEEAKPGCANFLLTIEGGEIFGDDVNQVDRFADLGVRMAALTWNGKNRIASPAAHDDGEGITSFGWQIVNRMHERYMAADISHLNIRGSLDLMDSGTPPMATHSCVYALCPHPRNLNDEQIRKLFACGGFVGVNFHSGFLSPDGHATVDTLVDHIAYFCNRGGENQVGLGSDFDGSIDCPGELTNAGKIHALFECMRRRGFDEKLIEKVAGLNLKAYLNRI